MRRLIHARTAMGGRHRINGLPCQDHAIAEELHGAQVLIVADGHGSRRHFRSERGSALACQVARDAIAQLLSAEPPAEELTAEHLTALGQTIIAEWRNLVAMDLKAQPWTEAELAEQQEILSPEQLADLTEGRSDFIPYGTTLVAAFATEERWAGLQIGDGMLVTLDSAGNYIWPMPESAINEGNQTASICMSDPELRVCSGTNPITGLFVCTDGIEKAYPVQSEKVVRALHWLWRAARDVQGEKLLSDAAEQFATQSAIQDDVGFALMADLEAEDVAPQPTEAQLRKRDEQFQGKWDEVVSIIRFNQRQLAGIQDPVAAKQLRASLAQCRRDLQLLRDTCPDPNRFQLTPELLSDDPPLMQAEPIPSASTSSVSLENPTVPAEDTACAVEPGMQSGHVSNDRVSFMDDTEPVPDGCSDKDESDIRKEESPGWTNEDSTNCTGDSFYKAPPVVRGKELSSFRNLMKHLKQQKKAP